MANIPVEPRRRSGGTLLLVVLLAALAALALWYFAMRGDDGRPEPAADAPAESRSEDPVRDVIEGAGEAAESAGEAVQDAADAVGEAVEDAADGR